MSAWNAVYKEILPRRNVLEVDFKGFFPSIAPLNLLKILAEYTKLPASINRFLWHLNESKPLFKFGAAMPEVAHTTSRYEAIMLEIFKFAFRNKPEYLYLLRDDKGLGVDSMWAPLKHWKSLANKLSSEVFATSLGLPSFSTNKVLYRTLSNEIFGMNKLREELKARTMANLSRMARDPRGNTLPLVHSSMNPSSGFVLSDEDSRLPFKMAQNMPMEFRDLLTKEPQMNEFKMRQSQFGLPQGSPLSPFLSTVILWALTEYMSKFYPNIKLLFYADDGFFYSDNDLDFISFLTSVEKLLKVVGITISWEKSVLRKLAGRNCHEISKDTDGKPDANQLAETLEGFPSNYPNVFKARLVNTLFATETPLPLAATPMMKFLGIIYNWETGELFSFTRSGRSLKFTHKSLITLGLQLNNKEFLQMFRKEYELNPSFPIVEALGYVYLLQTMKDWSPDRIQHFVNKELIYLGPGQKKDLDRFLTANLPRLLGGSRTSHQIGRIPPLRNLVLQGEALKSQLLGVIKDPSIIQAPFSGVYGGIVNSRLYLGHNESPKYDTPSGAQDFTLKVVKGSVGEYIKTRNPKTTLFTGSSLGCKHLLKMADSLR
jgi:hypothetical protein